MKTGLRKHASASARVRYCKLAPMPNNLREITNVRAYDQGKGHASALLRALCADADKDKTVMIVKVQPFAQGLDKDALADWYVRHGFSVMQLDPLVMVR